MENKECQYTGVCLYEGVTCECCCELNDSDDSYFVDKENHKFNKYE